METFSVYLNSLRVNQTLHSIVTRVWECQKELGNVMDNTSKPASTVLDKWEVLQRGWASFTANITGTIWYLKCFSLISLPFQIYFSEDIRAVSRVTVVSPGVF